MIEYNSIYIVPKTVQETLSFHLSKVSKVK